MVIATYANCIVIVLICLRMTAMNGAKAVTLEELMNSISDEQAKQSQQMYDNSL